MAGRNNGPISIRRQLDVAVVEFLTSSILDQRMTEAIKSDLEAIVEKGPEPKILVSFHGVKAISSSLVGVLMSLHPKIKRKNGEMRIAEIPAQIYDVFRITSVDKLYRIYQTEDEALHKFAST